MSLWKRGEVWYYDFWFQSQRYFASTRQTTRSDASVCEIEAKRRVRRQFAGLEAPSAVVEAPRFQDWAEVHFRERSAQMGRPEFLEHNLRTILRFWGARPKRDPDSSDPYHDLRFHDPIRSPIWIERFEPGCAAAAPPRKRAITIGPCCVGSTRPPCSPRIAAPAA